MKPKPFLGSHFGLMKMPRWARRESAGQVGERSSERVAKPLGGPRLEAVKAEFDSEFYLSQLRTGLGRYTSAFEHYLSVGWLIPGADPSPFFSGVEYLEVNNDVRKAQVNPFVHYVLFGRREGRLPMPLSGAKRRNAPNSQKAQPQGRAPEGQPKPTGAKRPGERNDLSAQDLISLYEGGKLDGHDEIQAFESGIFVNIMHEERVFYARRSENIAAMIEGVERDLELRRRQLDFMSRSVRAN